MATATPTASAAGTVHFGDIEVNRMGFGSMRLTGEGVWGRPEDPQEAVHVLRTAVHELEVNLVDTADSYGPNVAEELIAEALYPYPDHLVIATKGGLVRPRPNAWDPDGRPEHLREACEGSLKRLRLDRIDIYQFHRPDPDVPLEDSLGELVRLQEEGKIRHIGVSNFDVDQLERAVEITPIVSVQNRYNLDDRDADAVVTWCEEHDVVFLPWRPVEGGDAGGLLLKRVASAHEATATQVALAWLLHRSKAIAPIPGTSNVGHLRANVSAASIELTEEEMEELSSRA